MPTILDALVVELSLDTKGFATGQKKVNDALVDVGKGATSSAANIEILAKKLAGFFGLVSAPIATTRRQIESLAAPARTAHRHLADVGAQARRTGASVEAGGLAGAVGLRAMAAAGLAAGAAFEALDKIIKAAGKSADRTFAIGVDAGAAGMPVQQFDAIRRAAAIGGNVPDAQTETALVGFRQFFEKWRYGKADPGEIAQLVMEGVTNFGPKTSSDEILRQLAVQYSKFPAGPRGDSAAVAAGGQLGIGPELALWLRKVGPNFNAEVAKQYGKSETPGDYKAAQAYERALNQLNEDWTTFTRTLVTGVEPQLDRLLKGLDELIGPLTKLAEAVEWIWHLTDPSRFIPGGAGGSDGGSLGAWLRYEFGSGPRPGSGAGGSAHGSGGPRASGALATDVSRPLALIEKYESRGRNVFQQTGATDSTASGYWQITNTNWRKLGPGLGIDTSASGYPTAMSAPRALQAKVAQAMFDAGGGSYSDWAPYNKFLRAALARGEGAPQPSLPPGVSVPTADYRDHVPHAVAAANARASAGAPVTVSTAPKPTDGPMHMLLGPNGGVYRLTESQYQEYDAAMRKATMRVNTGDVWLHAHPELRTNASPLAQHIAAMSTIRSAKAGTTTHHHQNTVHQNVTINGVREANSIVPAVKDATRNAMTAAQANTGLQ